MGKINKKVNILLITTDEQRYDTLGCNGNPIIKTPHLDRLAAEGINFSEHTCSTPICTPARASILTGQYPRTHGAWDVGYTLDEKPGTLTDILGKNEYTCGIFGKSHFEAELSEFVLELDRNKPYYGFSEFKITEDNLIGDYLDWIREHHPDYLEQVLKLGNESTSAPYVPYETPMVDDQKIKGVFTSGLPEELHQTAWITDRTLEFIENKTSSDQPFFAWCSYVDPHHPWTPPEPFASMYDPENLKVPKKREGEDAYLGAYYSHAINLPDSEYQRMCAAYYGMISHIDHHIGRIVKYLEEISQLDNTIIIFTSDHGDFNGDHGLIRKGIPLFNNILKVPLIIRLPNRENSGAIYKKLSQHEDIFPSLLDYLEISIPDQIQGRSFALTMRKAQRTGKQSNFREYSFYEHYKFAVGVGKGPWKLMYYYPKKWPWDYKSKEQKDSDEFHIISFPKRGNGFVLTNSATDPLEYENLVGNKDNADIEQELRVKLSEWLLNTPLYYPAKEYIW